MRVLFDNCGIVFNGPPAVARTLDERTAFYVTGFQFSPAWKAGRWDGKEHLLRKRKGGHWAPIGLLGDLLAIARAQDVEVELDDRRRAPSDPYATVEANWNPKFQLRDYQEEAVSAIVKERGPLTGKGLVQIPTRGGKTVVMAAAIERLRLPTLVLVQSQLLLDQTVALFRDALGIRVGRVGSGVWDPGPVTVASCQTLARRAKDEETQELFRSFDVVFFDEVHHLSGPVWRGLLEEIDAFCKIGFSATIYLNTGKEAPKGSIWVRATTGPILAKREVSDLIRAGWLVQPWIELVRVDGPKIEGEGWSTIYRRGIVEHPGRNAAVVDAAVRHHEAGLQVLVVADQVDHTHALTAKLQDLGVRAEAVVGTTSAADRRALIRDYKAREIQALVGTVFGEGVDLPAIEAVVNAEGGKSKIAAMQRFRCLTPADGKDTAILTDFMDLHHPLLARHSRERLGIYRENEMFRLRIV